MNYPFQYASQFHALVSIYGNDGTVAISHGGVEIGQGINTKVSIDFHITKYVSKIRLEKDFRRCGGFKIGWKRGLSVPASSQIIE